MIEDFLKISPITNAKHAAGAIKRAIELPDNDVKPLILKALKEQKHVKNHAKIDEALIGVSIGVCIQPETRDQRPSKRIGGGSAHAREEKTEIIEPMTFREKILNAMGLDKSGIIGGSSFVGTQIDMIEANAWRSDLGLTEDQITDQVREVMKKKLDGPPVKFKYFTKAMQRLAEQVSKPRLEPTTGNDDGNEPRCDKPNANPATLDPAAFSSDPFPD